MNPYLRQALLEARVADLRYPPAAPDGATLPTLASKLSRPKSRTVTARSSRLESWRDCDGQIRPVARRAA